MFASVRSVRKAAIANGEMSASKVVPHNNKGYRVGRKYYVQSVVNESGKVVKTIVHVMSAAPDAWCPKRKKRRFKKCIKKHIWS